LPAVLNFLLSRHCCWHGRSTHHPFSKRCGLAITAWFAAWRVRVRV